MNIQLFGQAPIIVTSDRKIKALRSELPTHIWKFGDNHGQGTWQVANQRILELLDGIETHNELLHAYLSLRLKAICEEMHIDPTSIYIVPAETSDYMLRATIDSEELKPPRHNCGRTLWFPEVSAPLAIGCISFDS